MTDFHDWDDVRAELHDGDDDALTDERALTLAWMADLQLVEERERLGAAPREARGSDPA